MILEKLKEKGKTQGKREKTQGKNQKTQFFGNPHQTKIQKSAQKKSLLSPASKKSEKLSFWTFYLSFFSFDLSF